MKKTTATLAILALGACSTFEPPRYNILVDNNVALKSIAVGGINVGRFKRPYAFDNACRAGGHIVPPDNLTFEAYIQKAVADELSIAGMFDDKTPKITLTGEVERLSFSSWRGINGGEWDIGIRITSTNGKSMSVSHRYEFNIAGNPCQQTAQAFLPAVQDLIGKLVKAHEFRGLLVNI